MRNEPRRTGIGVGAAILLLTALAAPAAPDAPLPPAVRTLPDCGSVVVVRCVPAAADRPETVREEAARRGRERQFAARRSGDVHELDRIIIEGEAIRRRTFEAPAFPELKSVEGTTTTTIAERAQCTCMNRCPPIPFPCCQCSAHPSRYSLSPGSSPLR